MAYSLAPAQEMPEDFVVIYMQLGSIVLPDFSVFIDYTTILLHLYRLYSFGGKLSNLLLLHF